MASLNIPAAFRTIVGEISAPFQLSDRKLAEITNSLVGELKAGLKEAGRPVTMIPTFITNVPNGTERGTFLAIDLEWRVLRVSEVTLKGGNKSSRRNKLFQIPSNVLAGTSSGFFDYVAASIDSFLKESGIQLTGQTPVGVAVPFPLARTDLNKAKVIAWGKELRLQDGAGQNLEDLFQAAFDRKKLDLKPGAFVNDTVAVLLSESYGHPKSNCYIAAIFGVGTNGAYVEKSANIAKLGKQLGTQMLVNTELGAFSNKNALPLTDIDNGMDEDARVPGVYLFEKLVSWVFLGELVRRILVSLDKKAPHVLSDGFLSGLQEAGSLNSKYVPLLDQAKTVAEVKKVLSDGGIAISAASDGDAEIIRWVAQLVSTRAIQLCACAVAALITQAGYNKDLKDSIVIALAGEMLHFYSQFEGRLRVALRAIHGDSVEKRVVIRVAEDPQAIGAALGVYEMEQRK